MTSLLKPASILPTLNATVPSEFMSEVDVDHESMIIVHRELQHRCVWQWAPKSRVIVSGTEQPTRLDPDRRPPHPPVRPPPVGTPRHGATLPGGAIRTCGT
ncbi:hypothetical protein AB0C02_29755 [Micromonospora sp. NPDC048999]|uniref:hypothetical protein n=1 Tax=Micromonospora sp. NPDC048999 TaxID=3155391 RepID=UPI0033EB863E